jgi:hypothetical protein
MAIIVKVHVLTVPAIRRCVPSMKIVSIRVRAMATVYVSKQAFVQMPRMLFATMHTRQSAAVATTEQNVAPTQAVASKPESVWSTPQRVATFAECHV